MAYKYLHVTLSSELKKTFTLTYEIRSHQVGQIWSDCIKKSFTNGLRDNNRFYNFPNRAEQTLNSLIERLLKNIFKLKKTHPELDFPNFDPNNLSLSVNNLHQNFAHSHLVEFRINAENASLWHEFNILLHSIESNLGSTHSQSVSKFPHARIVFTWNVDNKIKIPENLFSEYDIGVHFGYAYFNYAQVGRQIFEIYQAKDTNVPKSHIRPAEFFSADTLLWFGDTTGDYSKPKLLNDLYQWSQQQPHSLLDKLSLKWGDPKLAIGQVSVGRLKNIPYSDEEKLQLIEKLSEFNIVSSIELD